MWATVATFLAGLFSSSKMTDTAVEALRKVGGLDEMTTKEKADWVITYLNTTKHQSVARRFIAITLTCLYALIVLLWAFGALIGYAADFDSMINFAGSMKAGMIDIIVQPFNIILSFYFVINIAEKLKSN